MPEAENQRPDCREDIVRRTFDRDPYADALGFTLRRITADSVAVSMVVRQDHLNFHAVTHGGALFSLADCAFSLASNAYDEPAVAIDTHLVITASSRIGDTLTATAVEMTRGRTLATYRVDVSRDDDRVVALFTGTVFVKKS